jgi:hypothetical protein
MRARTTIAIAAVAAAATATTFVAVRARRSGEPARPHDAADRPAGADLVPRSHYRLTYEQEIAMPGRAPVKVIARGTWTTTPHRSGRTEVRFAPAVLDGPQGALPAPAAVAAPIQLVHTGGVLSAMAFPAAMPAPGRALLTALATTFQRAARDGDAWTVAEEDLVGRYDAIYARTGDTIARRRGAYTALRGPGGLSAKPAGELTATEDTRFEVDADGLVRARIVLDQQIALGDQAPRVDVRLRAELERTAIEWVPPSATALLPAGPISDHTDHAAVARSTDENLVDGATVDLLLAELARTADLDAAVKGVSKERARLLARLAAAIRLDPSLAAKVAEQIRAHAADRVEVELLAGALGSARVPEGTDALAGLADLAPDVLPPASRATVMNALSVAQPVTSKSLGALTASLDSADHRTAVLALGSHRRRADEALAAQAAAAGQELLARYAAATGEDRVLYAKALGNSGDPAAVGPLRGAIAGSDPVLRNAAVYALRLVPGPEADAILAGALDDPDLAFSAVRAIGSRDPSVWRARLEAVRARYADRNDVQTAIHNVLRRWG